MSRKLVESVAIASAMKAVLHCLERGLVRPFARGIAIPGLALAMVVGGAAVLDSGPANAAGTTVNALAVEIAGTGAGSVSSAPAGIDCGNTCRAGFADGAVVTLTATPADQSRFDGWSGACTGQGSCQVTMDQARDVAAWFARSWVQVKGVRATPGALEFPGQSMHTTSYPLWLTVTNLGSTPVTVTDVRASAEFAQAHDCGLLDPAGSCSVRVSFTPALEGMRTGVLTVDANTIAGDTSTLEIALYGNGERSLVTHYYQSILRRPPDPPGKAYWDGISPVLKSWGANVNETWYAMATFFFFSAEYRALQRDDAGFVSDLYRAFFNRAPEPDGLAFWSGEIARGLPPEIVLATFLFSPEFTSFTEAMFGNTAVRPENDMTMDFYRGLLSRLPDAAGFSHWQQEFRVAQCTDALAVRRTVDAISSDFLNGPEYLARNRSNAQYVGDLYNAFLRRGGDYDGVMFWINQLDSGARSREALRQAFFDSPEFSARIRAVIDAGCW